MNILSGGFDEAEFETTLQLLQLTNAEHTNADGDNLDENLDLLGTLGDQAKTYLSDHANTEEDFAVLEARSVDDAIADYSVESIDYLYTLRGQNKK